MKLHTLVLSILIISTGTLSVFSRQPRETPFAKLAERQPEGEMGSAMMDRCNEMMSMHEKMMGKMKASNQRIDSLLETMNESTGAAKVDALAAVVNELVSQRRAMHERMMSFMPRMMHHMGEHMQMKMERHGMTGSMPECPMMKKMMDAGHEPSSPEGSHSQHHDDR